MRGTSTLLLIDERGIIVNFWTGRLQPDQVAAVFEALGKRQAVRAKHVGGDRREEATKGRTKVQYKLAGVTLLALACAATFAASAGQVGSKMIYLNQIPNARNAVWVTGVYIAGQKVQTGNYSIRAETDPGARAPSWVKPAIAVQADDKWIKNMTISFTNRTDKTITCVKFGLWFPDTKGANTPNSMTMYPLRLGQRPASALFWADGSKMPPDTGTPLFSGTGTEHYHLVRG